MIISAAQFKSVKGDIRANLERHKKLIGLALTAGSDTIVFPELSLSGYEPSLAQQLATTQDGGRFTQFQTLSNTKNITIGVGIPTINRPRPAISMVIFHPDQPCQTYSKQYIHADEEPYFVNGRNTTTTLNNHPHIALAICYEISVPEHAQAAADNGAEIYFASVAKTVKGVEQAHQRLSEIARTYSMTVLLANCVGMADGQLCGGRSAVWNNQGQLLAQLDGTSEGILICDTDTGEVTTRLIS
jgi:predicted amidohydrolase